MGDDKKLEMSYRDWSQDSNPLFNPNIGKYKCEISRNKQLEQFKTYMDEQYASLNSLIELLLRMKEQLDVYSASSGPTSVTCLINSLRSQLAIYRAISSKKCGCKSLFITPGISGLPSDISNGFSLDTPQVGLGLPLYNGIGTQTLTFQSTGSILVINVNSNMSVSTISGLVNNSSTNQLKMFSITTMRISGLDTSGNLSFTLHRIRDGTSQASSNISINIVDPTDIENLVIAINLTTNVTRLTSEICGPDSTDCLLIKSLDGDDIAMENIVFPGSFEIDGYNYLDRSEYGNAIVVTDGSAIVSGVLYPYTCYNNFTVTSNLARTDGGLFGMIAVPNTANAAILRYVRACCFLERVCEITVYSCGNRVEIFAVESWYQVLQEYINQFILDNLNATQLDNNSVNNLIQDIENIITLISDTLPHVEARKSSMCILLQDHCNYIKNNF